jgi:hypothetical protein
MKITIAWNVWNNYEDVALGSEIARLQNNEKKVFEDLHLISQGGYREPPSPKETQYLDGHFFVETPISPLSQMHIKFPGVLRVIEGLQLAFRYGQKHGHDYVLITNADSCALSLEKLYNLLDKKEVRNSALAARVGLSVGLKLTFGNCVPLFDDHFIVINVKESEKAGVFDYDHSARFFSPHFGYLGGIHNILCCFVDQRVPEGKFFVYTYCQDCLGLYGDCSGWNLLPWQYQPSTGFLHANCQQLPSLNNLRAALFHDFGFTRYPYIGEYYRKIMPRRNKFIRRNGVLVYQKPLKKKLLYLVWLGHKGYHSYLRNKYKKKYQKLGLSYKNSPLYYFDIYKKVIPLRYGG